VSTIINQGFWGIGQGHGDDIEGEKSGGIEKTILRII
jgi:hypothetical protein